MQGPWRYSLLSISIYLILAIFSCANSPEHNNTPKAAWPEDDGTLVFSCFLYARSVGDIYSRSYLFESMAKEWYRRGNENAALAVLNYWQEDVALSVEKAGRFQLEVAIARCSLFVRQADLAKKNLQDLLGQISSQSDVKIRAQNLADYISLCLAFPADSSDYLRRSLQYLYSLPDAWQKSYLLTEFASYYQGQGGRRAYNLLQQAIPAASSIGSIFQKAEAYVRIANGMLLEGYKEDAERMARIALETINEQEIISISDFDAQSLARLLPVLAKMGFTIEANSLINLLPLMEYRAPTIEVLIIKSFKDKQSLLGRLMIQRMISSMTSDRANVGRLLFYLGNVVRDSFKDYPVDNEWLIGQVDALISRVDPALISDSVRLEYASKLYVIKRADLAQKILAGVQDGSEAVRYFLSRFDLERDLESLIIARGFMDKASFDKDILAVNLGIREFVNGQDIDVSTLVLSLRDPLAKAEVIFDLLNLVNEEMRNTKAFALLRVKIRTSLKI